MTTERKTNSKNEDNLENENDLRKKTILFSLSVSLGDALTTNAVRAFFHWGPNQIYQTKPIEPNLPSLIYKIKSTKRNV